MDGIAPPVSESIEGQQAISEEQYRFFIDNGYLVLRDVVRGEELRRLQRVMTALMDYGLEAVQEDPDYMYAGGHATGEMRLRRIEYVIDKTRECKVLLGHPFILRSVERIIGPDFIPTWDSMVIKLPGEGIVVPWHRDAGAEQVGDRPIFNVDFYLDPADEDTCVWAYPGSHKWSDAEADAVVARQGFSTEEAVPLLMQPGDVLFHNILLVHGSPPNSTDKLRRVLYYEFRPAHVEAEIGPHTPEYIPLKQRMLLKCLQFRREAGYVEDDSAFEYNPPAPFDTVKAAPKEDLETYRYAHEDFWRG